MARRLLPAAVSGLFAAGLGGVACARPAKTSLPAPEPLRVRVVASYPHDQGAFTQGLLYFDGKVYESTGLLGHSSLRRVDLRSGEVEARVALGPEVFGEGLARVGGRLYQLTWRNGRVLIWNLGRMEKEREIAYQGEGWGLCADGKRLVMSDGSDRLTLRDPRTFAKVGEVAVRRAGVPLRHLNELECVDGLVYANIWQAPFIARIDLETGVVTGWIDASALLTRHERMQVDVLNGIAHLPGTNRFLLTGKLWPRVFEVEIVPAEVRKHDAAGPK